MVSYSTRERPVTKRRRFDLRAFVVLLAFLGISAAVAGFGSVAAVSGVDGWYAHAQHVEWTPPNWTFGAIWSVLYVMIAVAGWLVWRAGWRASVRAPLTFFVIQLVINSVWTPVYFAGFQVFGSASTWAALAIILLLDFAVACTIVSFWRVSHVAALLLVPYMAWILYASSLNWGDAILLGLG